MTSMALSPSEARGRSGGHPFLREEAAPRREFDEGMRELSKSVRRRIQWERSPLNDAIDQSARDLEDAFAMPTYGILLESALGFIDDSPSRGSFASWPVVPHDVVEPDSNVLTSLVAWTLTRYAPGQSPPPPR